MAEPRKIVSVVTSIAIDGLERFVVFYEDGESKFWNAKEKEWRETEISPPPGTKATMNP